MWKQDIQYNVNIEILMSTLGLNNLENDISLQEIVDELLLEIENLNDAI